MPVAVAGDAIACVHVIAVAVKGRFPAFVSDSGGRLYPLGTVEALLTAGAERSHKQRGKQQAKEPVRIRVHLAALRSKAKSIDPRRQFLLPHAALEYLSVQQPCALAARREVLVGLAHTAAARGGKRNDCLAGQVTALQKRVDDRRGDIPPGMSANPTITGNLLIHTFHCRLKSHSWKRFWDYDTFVV